MKTGFKMSDNTLCSGTCNQTKNSVVTTQVTPEPMFLLRPETGEILECPAASAAALRREIALLDHLLDELLTRQFASQQALEQFQQAHKDTDSGAIVARQHAAEQALRQEASAREAMFKEFKDLPKFNDGGKGLLELLPLATRKGDALYRSKRMTYVRSDKVKNHLRTYHNLPGDAAKMKSFYTKGEDGRYKLDQKKLANAFNTVPVKSELAKTEVSLWAEGWTPQFVEAFNAEYDPDKRKEAADKATPQDASVQFSGGATLLRFFAGAGLSATAELGAKSFKDLLRGRGEVSAKFSGAARAGVDLASAKVQPKLYLPTRHGLNLCIPAGKSAKGGRQELELGHVRLLIEGELGVSCGASAIAQAGLEFKLKADMTQGMRGASTRKTAQAMSKPRARVDRGGIEAEAGASGELSAFAGAEALAGVSGALQWQKPEMLEFVNFAKIDAKGRAQAGAGGTAMFAVDYRDGKFQIVMKLGACVGLGLKGELAAEVGVKELLQFDAWFKHQVTNAYDQNLRYFEQEAWKAFVLMKALAIAEGKRLEEYLGRAVDDLQKAWRKLVDAASEATLRRIRQSRDYVLTSVAEAKALLLGLLEQMNANMQELRHEIAETARWLFGAVQTTLEADNVYQRIGTAMDSRIAEQAGHERLAALVGGMRQVEMIVAEFKTEPTPGYVLAFAHEAQYQFARGAGLHMAWRRSPLGRTNTRLA
jgi:hypothetical protein